MAENDMDRLDVEAMLRVARGDREAFGELIDRHQNALLNFFRRMGASTHEGEDLAQETFLRLYSWRERYEPKAKFTTFFYTLARHVWADHLRKEMRSPKTSGGELSTEMPHPESGSGAAELNLDIKAALAKISEKLRSVIVLNVYHGLQYKEIAEVLDIPEGTVKSRMFLGLRELRKYLEPTE
ncbi:MAG: sigma-70 family RNA polymerase sigma factor [Planctomycetes bacterium]|nr:sigma-70 family RNA polymerase sigma factor [Planctomycetota bacterium]